MALVEVKCPHCGARGQVVLPPTGVIVMGPCPECHEFIAVFAGRTVAVDKTVMSEGTPDEQSAHLLAEFTEFLKERIKELLVNMAEEVDTLPGASEGEAPHACASPITSEDIAGFVETELELIDNPDYFKSVFG